MESAIVPFTPIPPGRDYYAILGVGRNASLEALNDAYNYCAGLCHPDLVCYDANKLPIGSLTQAEYWHLVNEAYEVLSNPEYRHTYDMIGEHGLKHCWVSPHGFQYRFSGDCLKIFENFKASYRGVSCGMPELEGATVAPWPRVITVFVTLDEMFQGATRRISYLRNITSAGVTTEAADTVSLDIVPGTMDGTRLVKPLAGDIVDGSCGDLYFDIKQLPHPVFCAHGEHLSMVVPLPLKVAMIGGLFTVTCIDGKQLTLLFKHPFYLGHVLKLPGEGMPIPYTNRRGDLHIHFLVNVPTNVPPYLRYKLGHLLDQCS